MSHSESIRNTTNKMHLSISLIKQNGVKAYGGGGDRYIYMYIDIYVYI
jgi:hypothetical protein